MRTLPDLPVHPDTPGIVLRSGQRTAESGELPHAPTAPNIASTLGAAPAATAVDHLPCDVANDGSMVASKGREMRTAPAATAVDHLTCNVADDGFVVASAARGMKNGFPPWSGVCQRNPRKNKYLL